MERYPGCQLTVLAGHTHDGGRYTVARNVHVRTAAAVYGHPRIAELLTAADGSLR
jgi:hypothetical protein